MFMISDHFLSAMPKGSEERWAESGGGRAEAPAEPITIHHDMPQKVFQWWEEVPSECCSMIVLPVPPTSATSPPSRPPQNLPNMLLPLLHTRLNPVQSSGLTLVNLNLTVV